MSNPIMFVVWLLVLIFISFIIAGFCAGWYIILYPLTVCIKELSDRNPVWCFAWFIFLLLSFPLALMAALLYIIFSPLSVCLIICADLSDILLFGVQFPLYCADRMVCCYPMRVTFCRACELEDVSVSSPNENRYMEESVE